MFQPLKQVIQSSNLVKTFIEYVHNVFNANPKF